MSQTNQNVICFYFCIINFCFDGEADAKQELESMSIPNHNCCDVCRNVCNCEECLLIEAMDSVEVDDKQMKDQPPETEK